MGGRRSRYAKRAAIASQPTSAALAAERALHLPELDALRGLAALVVVFSHYFGLWSLDTLDAGQRALFGQVLYPLFIGRSSVILFFVLSGFVLTLPYVRGRPPRYSVFIRRRLARIYLPYVAALALGVAGDVLLARPILVNSWFSQTWTMPVTPGLVANHLLLVGTYADAQINTAFWSLAVEMRLSIVFPLVCLLLLRAGRPLVLTLVAVTSAFIVLTPHFLVGRLGAQTYNAVVGTSLGLLSFALGFLLARHLERVRAVWGWLGPAQRAAAFVAALVLFEWASDLGGTRLAPLQNCVAAAGAVGIMAAALCSPRSRQLLNRPVTAWLGRISYSLYLVHGTVLFALVHGTYGSFTRLQLLIPFLALSLVVAQAFYVLVEQPCIGLSRRIGRAGKNLPLRSTTL